MLWWCQSPTIKLNAILPCSLIILSHTLNNHLLSRINEKNLKSLTEVISTGLGAASTACNQRVLNDLCSARLSGSAIDSD
jgi:hypothetical protein